MSSNDLRTAIVAALICEIRTRRPHWIGGVPQASDVLGLCRSVAHRAGATLAAVERVWAEEFSNGF